MDSGTSSWPRLNASNATNDQSLYETVQEEHVSLISSPSVLHGNRNKSLRRFKCHWFQIGIWFLYNSTVDDVSKTVMVRIWRHLFLENLKISIKSIKSNGGSCLITFSVHFKRMLCTRPCFAWMLQVWMELRKDHQMVSHWVVLEAHDIPRPGSGDRRQNISGIMKIIIIRGVWSYETRPNGRLRAQKLCLHTRVKDNNSWSVTCFLTEAQFKKW